MNDHSVCWALLAMLAAILGALVRNGSIMQHLAGEFARKVARELEAMRIRALLAESDRRDPPRPPAPPDK